jgi:hypothetical protein
MESTLKHTWEAQPDGSVDGINYNYLQCKCCGFRTRSYPHGNFLLMEYEKTLVDTTVPCIYKDEEVEQEEAASC